MRFPALVWKNLWQRPARSLLTMAGIAIGIAAVVALTSIAWGFEATWQRVYSARGTDLIVMKAGSLSPVPAAFAREQVSGLDGLPRVAQTSAVLSDLLGVEQAPIVLVMGLESNTFVWDHLRLLQGRWPAGDDDAVVVLGSVAVDVLRKDIGSTIRIENTTFTVCGVFESPSLAENGAIVSTLPQAQRALGQPGRINFLNLKVNPEMTAAEVQELRRTIAARWPGLRALDASEVAGTNSGVQAVRAMSRATSAIALIAGGIGVMNTMLMSVFERVAEIGILLAIGWRRQRVAMLIFWESLALSVAGGMLGMAAGAAGVAGLEMTPLLKGKIAGSFDLSLFVLASGVSVGLGILGGLYPAWRGSRMHPAQALRSQ